MIDWLGSELVADWRRFYGADLASDVEEAIRHPRHWATIEAMVDHLPPEAASKRAQGEWSEYERIADELLQNVSASRIEFLAANSEKGRAAKGLKVASHIGREMERRFKKSRSVADVYRAFVGMGAEEVADGSRDA